MVMEITGRKPGPFTSNLQKTLEESGIKQYIRLIQFYLMEIQIEILNCGVLYIFILHGKPP